MGKKKLERPLFNERTLPNKSTTTIFIFEKILSVLNCNIMLIKNGINMYKYLEWIIFDEILCDRITYIN
jgi:hypothetical protein